MGSSLFLKHLRTLHPLTTVCGENPFPHILVSDCARDKIQVQVWLQIKF